MNKAELDKKAVNIVYDYVNDFRSKDDDEYFFVYTLCETELVGDIVYYFATSLYTDTLYELTYRPSDFSWYLKVYKTAEAVRLSCDGEVKIDV